MPHHVDFILQQLLKVASLDSKYQGHYICWGLRFELHILDGAQTLLIWKPPQTRFVINYNILNLHKHSL